MFLLMLLALSQAIDEQHLIEAYFRGRTNQVQTTGDLLQGEDNLVFLGGNINLDKNYKSEIDVTELGDILVRSLWLGTYDKTKMAIQTNEGEAEPRYEYDFPTANLFMANFGVDREHFEKLPNQEFTQDTLPLDLAVRFYPADEVSVVSSVLTGATPRLHGITAARWTQNGEPVEAFSTSDRSVSELSMYDLVKAQIGLKNLHVVGAATGKVLAKTMTANQFGASYFESPHKFTSDSDELSFTWETLLKSMENDEVWKNVRTNLANLDLNSNEVELFLMEMEYLNQVAKSFDAHKDELSLYSLSTTTLEPLAHNEDVLTIFSYFTDHLIQAFQQAYPEGNYQVAFLKKPALEPQPMLETKLAGYNYNGQNLNTLNYAQLDDVCGTDGVVCVTKMEGDTFRTYQISVWLLFWAGVATLAFSCYFCGLDFSQDATLYTTWVASEY